MTHKWVGRPYLGAKYRTRKDAAMHALLGHYPMRVQFRFETVWIVEDPNEITTVTTPEGKKLVGYPDPYMLTHGVPDAEAFVNALSARHMDNFASGKAPNAKVYGPRLRGPLI